MRSPKFLILAAIAVAAGVLGVLVVRELEVAQQEQRITKLAKALTGRQVEVRPMHSVLEHRGGPSTRL